MSKKQIISLLLFAVMLFGTFSAPAPVHAANGAENYPLNSIVIKIEDIVTHQMLGGARFEIYFSNDEVSGGYGTLVATVDSDGSGVIVLSGLPSGYYIVRQTMPPNNYHLSINNEQHCFIKPDGTSIEELIFSNYRYGGLAVILNDKDTGAPIPGATFSVSDVNGKAVGNHADGVYTTDSRGEFFLENLPAGDYKITQLTAAQGYAMDSAPSTRTIRLQHTNTDQSVFLAQFSNSPLGTLLVRLKDSVSKEPIAGAVFNVKLSGGADLGEFTTGADGAFSLPEIARGSYIVTQITTVSGYLIVNTPKTQYVNYVNTYAVDFENQPRSGLYVTKYDKETKTPLKDAKFQVYQESTLIGTYTTNADGVFFIPNLDPGWYTVSEYAAPQGYILDDTPKSVQVIAETLHRMEFENSKLASLQIIKTDEYNGDPLSGARFRVTTQNGEFVADVTTDGSGKAVIPAIAPGWYVISETKAPNGYLITEAARTVEVKSIVPTVVTITNRAENNLEIVKLDFFTRAPLSGATFKVEHANGANVGTFNTDSGGKILIGNLAEGAYVVSEIKAPDGYQLDSEPQTVVIEGGKLHSVEFLDKALTAIEIVKTDSVSKLPLADATFKVEKPNGEVIGAYKTDVSGKAIVTGLESGTYVVSETAAPDGYILHETPKTVTVASGKITTVEFTNKPYSGIQILKTDSVTHDPLSDATFKITRPNGELIGTYKTDVSGKAVISDLEEGTYIVSETIPPSAYKLNEIPQTVTVVSGRVTIVEFANDPYGSLIIKKLDEITERPLIGARFTVRHQGGEVVGENYTTGADGSVTLSNLAPGWYVIDETRAPDGYELDSTAKTIEVKPHTPTIITFTNRPHSGIEILKIDALTKTPLSGAVFTVQRSNGDKIGGKYTTDVSGKILIPDLAEGTYILSEIEAPAEYILDAQPQTVQVISGKLTYAEFTNTPYPYLHIVKTDASTGQLLSGAEFTVTNAKGEIIARVTSQSGGAVSLKVAPGIYTVTETKAPSGYELNDPVQQVEVRADGSAVYYGTSITYPNNTASFANRPLNAIEILKLDEITKSPLPGALFRIDNSNGERIGEFRTDNDGMVLLTGLTEGAYVIGETAAPTGYILNEIPQTVSVSGGKLVPVVFLNKPLSGIQIMKLDAVTTRPLADAAFTVTRANGEEIGTFRTGTDGNILVPNLDEGAYIVGEVSAPRGYQLDETPKTVNVLSGRLAAVEFTNKPYSGIEIIKTDAVTHDPLAGAAFSVTKADGQNIGTFRTGADGKVLIPDLTEGAYIVGEVSAPDGYQLDEMPKNVTVDSGRLAIVEFTNKPYSGIEIIKTDAITHEPLAGASFTVERANGEQIGIYRTDSAGKIVVPGLSEGSYIVAETIAPTGYRLDETPKTVTVTSGRLTEVEFVNSPYGSITIKKTDEITGNPLAGADFTVKQQNGAFVGDFTTDSGGLITIPSVEPGWYVVNETKAPAGYILDSAAQTLEIKASLPAVFTFTNKPLSGIEIIKTDAVSHAPLMGATFTVERGSGERVGTYKTDEAGKILVSGLSEGVYVVAETIAPDGYQLDETPQNVTVTSGRLSTAEFANKPHSGIEILKLDAITNAPLSGATFTVERDNGENIGTFKTDMAGKIIVPDLAEGTYIASETIAPDGYTRDEAPKTVIVKSGKITAVEFRNKPHSGIEVIKLDAETKAPLTGAAFLVERDSGERIGAYTTDSTGKFIVPDLIEGTYIVSETDAPDGYILDEAPKTVIVNSGKVTVVEFFNKPLAGLKIIKLDSSTRRPIAGVEFEIAAMSGEKVENDFRGYTFKTDRTGQIYIPNLPNGYYTVTETRSADGYILEGEPKTVLVESGKPTILEVLNTPASGLLIVKRDANTGEPLEGVVFDVRRADGQFVAGSIIDGNQPNTENNSPNRSTSPNGDISGSYTTDRNGRILINALDAGQYNVTERKALDGYELDTEVHSVTVTPGKLATLQLENTPKAGLRVVKIDSVTKKPIYNVEFMLFDANNHVVGTYYTDNNGVIDFPMEFKAGRYTIRETRAAAGYYLDEIPKTVEFTAGKVTEIVWTNVPQMGQVQILKLAGDDNEVNGLPSGTPLEGAVFEIYNYKNGNLVDRFVSGSDGRAVSSPLPLGRYTVKEVQPPKYYKLSDRVLDIEVEFATQIIKEEFLNYSANTGVYIKKTGNLEAQPGDTIRYDIKAVQNTGTIPLTDFFWRDVLPVDAVRLNKIVTGTYNQSLKYKIMATTNKGDTIIITDNLSTTMNNSIDCSPASLGLRNDEFVTSFSLVFGNVKARFAQVEQPQVYVDVLKSLPNGYRFANKCDVGGRYAGEWIIGSSTHSTVIFTSPGKLPKTGY
jgi:uncharacterized repeat protein (TIGR01451 family)